MLVAVFSIIVLLFSIIIHEIAHGSVAYSLGDRTAKEAGRLTLNPLEHLDLFGSIILPAFLLIITMGQGPIFGWAKPVPINPFNFKNPQKDMIKVSLAGPSMNFLIALTFGLIIRFLFLPASLLTLFSIIVVYNLAWGIFNLVPIPPLDGSHIFSALLPKQFSNLSFAIQQYGLFILILFIYFGLPLVFWGAVFLYYLITGQSLPI